MRYLILAAAAAAAFAATPASAASYSCMEGYRLNAAERAVCRSPVLSRLDERLDSWYQRALTRARYFDQTSMVRGAQRDWLDDRNACGWSYVCLRDAYRTRLKQLRNYVEHV